MKTEQIVALFVILLFVVFIAVMMTQKKDDVKKIENTITDTPVSSSSSVSTEQKSSTSSSIMSEQKSESSPASFDADKTYTAVLTTTEGVIKIQLNSKQTPITANNFITLSKKNFYNNTIFHRTIKGFMIQGGDPNGDGTGGPGYKFKDEKFEGEYKRGTVAMANSGPDTNGSQFFIMHQDYPLPKNYTIFGQVTEGLEVVDKIAEAPVEDNGGGEASKPVNPVKVEKVEIVEQ